MLPIANERSSLPIGSETPESGARLRTRDNASAAAIESGTHVTKVAFKVAKFPFFIRGCQCLINSGSHRDPMSSALAVPMGLGLILISVPIGIPANIVGAGVSAGAGAYTLGAKAVNHFHETESAEQYRAYLTQKFVESLAARLAKMPEGDQAMYKEHPELLAGAEAIEIAFLSRNSSYNVLEVGSAKIHRDDLDGSVAQTDFYSIHGIKNAIQSLKYSHDDGHAWEFFHNEADLWKEGKLDDRNRADWFRVIDIDTREFAERRVNDEVFQTMWREKFGA